MDTSESINLLAMIGMSLGLTAIGFALRRPTIAFASSFSWVLMAVYCYMQSQALWDIMYGAFLFGILMFFLCALEGSTMGRRQEDIRLDEEEESPDGAEDDDVDALLQRLRQRGVIARSRRRYKAVVNRLRGHQ